MRHLMKEGTKLATFPVLLFFSLLFVSHTLPAQEWAARLFKTGKYARYKCVNMGAYNKHRTSRLKKESKYRRTQPVAPGTITQAAPHSPVSRPPASEPSPSNPVKEPSTPTTASITRVKPEKSPPISQPEETPPVVTRREQPDKVPPRKMTEEQRRQYVMQTKPDTILPPVRFITAQDEFSVVNMDSFMNAMELAQQGKIILIEGHTDDVGSDDFNLKLSMKRAEKIRELMRSGGVNDDQISVIGFGETQPLVPNTSAENRAVNRRIEFKVFSPPR